MDSSHILFVIANVADGYNCLCAIQVKNSFEPQDDPIRRCLRVLTIFATLENRTPISEELLYPRVEAGTLQDGPMMHQHHIHTYPYITTCLALGASFNPDIAYHSGYSSKVLKTGTLFEENDADISGFTAIDISDMRALRYCFLKFAEDSDTDSVSLTPFSADTYIKAYENQPGENEDALKTLCEGFKGYGLIRSDILGYMWPHLNWKKNIQPAEVNENDEDYDIIAIPRTFEVEEGFREEIPIEGEDGDEDVDKDEDEALQNFFLNPSGREENSLQHNRVAVILHALESRASFNTQRINGSFMKALRKNPSFYTSLANDFLMLMENEINLHCSRPAQWLLGRCFFFRRTKAMRRLQERVWSLARNFLPSPLVLYFLANYFEDEANLGVFKNIGVSDLVGSHGLLQQIRQVQNKGNRTISVLNLSRSPFNALGLRKILQTTPGIKTLYLMHTPYLPIQSVLEVLAQTGTELVNLYHTDLFAPFVASLTRDLDEKSYEDMRKKTTPPFERPPGRPASSNLQSYYIHSQVAQMISIFTSHEALTRLANESNEPFNCEMFPMETLEATLREEREQDPRTRKKLPAFALNTFPLHDTLLSPARLVTGLAQFAKFCLGDRITGDRFHLYGHVLASCIARGKRFRTKKQTFPVGPPPLMIACDNRRFASTWQTPTPTPERMARHTYWSILVVHEALPDKAGSCSLTDEGLKWRYAFIAPKEGREVLISQKQGNPALVKHEKPQFQVLGLHEFLLDATGPCARHYEHDKEFDKLCGFWYRFCLQHEGKIEVLGEQVAHALLAKMEGVGKRFW